jgi:aldose 1-epimerase
VELHAIVAPQPGWPVPLATGVRYGVDASGLTVTHTVRNVGAEPVPFGVGAHPYLRAGAAATDDCTLTLAAQTSLPLEGGLPTGPAVPVAGELDLRAGRPLRGMALDHAFGGCVPAAGDALVRHRLEGPDGAVELWAEPDFGWVQVFTPADHPGRGRAVAVEPMTCPPDALNSGEGLITLAPGAEWTGSWGIRPV